MRCSNISAVCRYKSPIQLLEDLPSIVESDTMQVLGELEELLSSAVDRFHASTGPLQLRGTKLQLSEKLTTTLRQLWFALGRYAFQDEARKLEHGRDPRYGFSLHRCCHARCWPY